MQDKWFSETREGAEKFRQNYSDLDGVVNKRGRRELNLYSIARELRYAKKTKDVY